MNCFLPPHKTILEKRRRALGASLRELSAVTGVPFSLLGKIENRVKPCPLKHAYSLCAYFQALIEDLFDTNGS